MQCFFLVVLFLKITFYYTRLDINISLLSSVFLSVVICLFTDLAPAQKVLRMFFSISSWTIAGGGGGGHQIKRERRSLTSQEVGAYDFVWWVLSIYEHWSGRWTWNYGRSNNILCSSIFYLRKDKFCVTDMVVSNLMGQIICDLGIGTLSEILSYLLKNLCPPL